jgi:hypothetical protein
MYISARKHKGRAMNAFSELNYREAQQVWDIFEAFIKGFREKDPDYLLDFVNIMIGKQKELTRLIALGASELAPVRHLWISIRLDLKFPVETQGQIEAILSAAALRCPALFVIKEMQRNHISLEDAEILASLASVHQTSIFEV